MKPVGPRYMKSLHALLKGPLGVHDRLDIVRYRALQLMGLVAGIELRCVYLTDMGREAIASGLFDPTPVAKVRPTRRNTRPSRRRVQNEDPFSDDYVDL